MFLNWWNNIKFFQYLTLLDYLQVTLLVIQQDCKFELSLLIRNQQNVHDKKSIKLGFEKILSL